MSGFAGYDPRRGSDRAWLLGIASRVFARHCEQSASGQDAEMRLQGRRALHEDEIDELTERIDAEREGAALGSDEHGDIGGATPYSLRRGMISLRIRAGEDRQTIAKQCGTSVEMLERSYSFVIENLEDEGPRPAEEERLRARQLAVERTAQQLRVA